MNDQAQTCPKCNSPYGYPDGSLWTCPESFHEWSLQAEEDNNQLNKFIDANGNELKDGDSVTIIKDLKMGKDTLKSGTKAKNIRLLDEPINGHDISCKINGFGSLYLKCSVVKKA